jgi:hypothetical protein
MTAELIDFEKQKRLLRIAAEVRAVDQRGRIARASAALGKITVEQLQAVLNGVLCELSRLRGEIDNMENQNVRAFN